MKIHILRKKTGETPLEALRNMVKERGLPENGKYTYAGRLDPMAEGVLVILQDATQTEREAYLKLPKEYKAEVLLGIGTDTGDVLGIPKNGENKNANMNELRKITKNLIPFARLPVPAYSSVPVQGKSGFAHARAGKKVKMPVRKMEIFSITIGRPKNISGATLLKSIHSKINKVRGDFRQENILKAWNTVLSKGQSSYQIFPLTIRCGSGTYIRSVAEYLGRQLGTKGTLFYLKRIRVGNLRLTISPPPTSPRLSRTDDPLLS